MLTQRETSFVSEYLVDFNATQAAIRAGYSARTAKQAGSRLLTKPAVRDAIEAKRRKHVQSTDLTAARVLEELRRVGLSDVRNLFDEHGNLKPIHTLSADDAACIAGIEVIVKNAKAGDGHTDTIHKIKVWDKPRTLEMLAKHFALLTDVVRVDDQQALIGKLLAGRQRAAEGR